MLLDAGKDTLAHLPHLQGCFDAGSPVFEETRVERLEIDMLGRLGIDDLVELLEARLESDPAPSGENFCFHGTCPPGTCTQQIDYEDSNSGCPPGEEDTSVSQTSTTPIYNDEPSMLPTHNIRYWRNGSAQQPFSQPTTRDLPYYYPDPVPKQIAELFSLDNPPSTATPPYSISAVYDSYNSSPTALQALNNLSLSAEQDISARDDQQDQDDWQTQSNESVDDATDKYAVGEWGDWKPHSTSPRWEESRRAKLTMRGRSEWSYRRTPRQTSDPCRC